MSAGEAFPGVCTDWRRHDVPAMWQMLANEDGQHSWDQVTGWRQISELLNLHSGRLRTAREQLAASWPAGGSGAASVFMAFVDQLLGSMDGTATVAAGNSAALAGITTSLGTAREAMEQLHDQWQRYAEAEHHSTEPTIRRGSPGVLEPRLSQDWRQNLNQHGATVMTAMENEVLDYAQSTTVPGTYVPAPVLTASASWTPPNDEPARERYLDKQLPGTSYDMQSDIPSYGSASVSYPGPILSELPPSSDSIGDHQIGIAGRPAPGFPITVSGQRNAVAGPVPFLGRTVPTARQSNEIGETRQPISNAADERTQTASAGSAAETSKERLPPSGPGGVPQHARAAVERRKAQAYVEHEWTSRSGVPPVLEPSKRHRPHNPEPGVIGIDR